MMIPGEPFTLWRNQGWREGWCLAVLGKKALVEYEMPAGSTALVILDDRDDPDHSHQRSISYQQLSRKWLEAIVAEDMGWIGKPQQSRGPTPTPRELLRKKKGGEGHEAGTS